ncbi:MULTISPECIES: GNAT family N-acetyltransferase [unclassified Spongiibacter]|uniref:GNAT family N-acetyltransferase n=1 Tax=unclassified Spongiibacter TaxID=2631504 RepID=UPI000C370A15|nr:MULTISPECIES: GNAT family N-acetyltransferase [unclassified Spongiibacter]MAY37730.1 hypothetical protein [Spongiibacter sp.]MBI58234.1 hypothetical protein [Spongiibacter sp.]
MPGAADFQRYCQQLASALRAAGHRACLLLSGEESWGVAMAEVLMSQGDGLLLAPEAIAGQRPASKPESLGIESDWLVINAHHYQSLNQWLAAAGTLRAGGLLVLLCPPMNDWPADYAASMRHQGFDVDDSAFIRRLCREWPTASNTLLWCQKAPLPDMPPTPEASWQATLPSEDQCRTVQAICRAAKGRAGRPLLIRADRGRGKTTALGLAAAELLRDQRRIVITAARPGMIETAFRHAQSALPDARREKHALSWREGRLEYLPPAELLSRSQTPDLLLVDEAAHLSLTLLDTLLQRYPRLVFASTVHGYEGSGRGFDIRFRRCLDRRRPHWRREYLRSPLRWAEDDPLEAGLNRLFLLDADVAMAQSSDPLVVNLVDPDTLIREPSLLRQVHGLLLDAHYQTTPQDLQFLLDLPGRIWVARRGENIVGVCQAFVEGGFDKTLAEATCAGRRRPRGHLLAQTLAVQTGNPKYLLSPSLRVNRIAVVDGERRAGVASALLAALSRQANEEGMAFLSSSFACEPDVVAFWHSARFIPLHLGSRRDAASGSYSLMVALALGEGWSEDFVLQQQRFAQSLLTSFRLIYPEMPPEALQALLSVLPALSDSDDLRQLQRYAAGQLSFEMAAPSLKRCCAGRLVSALCIERLFYEEDWSALARRYRLDGRGAIETEIKSTLSALIDV